MSSNLSFNRSLFKDELTHIKNEWAIFSDPAIQVGTQIQPTWLPLTVIRSITSTPHTQYQINRTYTGQIVSGAYTKEAAEKLNQDLAALSIKTKQLFLELFKNIEEEALQHSPSKQGVNAPNLELIKIAREAFLHFSQARKGLILLRHSFIALKKEDQKASSVQNAYIQAYNEAIKQVNQDFAEVVNLYLNKVYQGKLPHYLSKDSKAKFSSHTTFSSEITEINSFTIEQLQKLSHPVKEFFSVWHNLSESLKQIVEVFNTYKDKINEDDWQVLEVDECQKTCSDLDNFLSKVEAIQAKLSGIDSTIQLSKIGEIMKELTEVFSSEEWHHLSALWITVTSANTKSTFTLRRQIMDKIEGFKKSAASWQELVYQATTSRLQMPLTEILKSLRDFQAPQEVTQSLTDILDKLLFLAQASQTFSASDSSSKN